MMPDAHYIRAISLWLLFILTPSIADASCLMNINSKHLDVKYSKNEREKNSIRVNVSIPAIIKLSKNEEIRVTRIQLSSGESNFSADLSLRGDDKKQATFYIDAEKFDGYWITAFMEPLFQYPKTEKCVLMYHASTKISSSDIQKQINQ
jgi:hypothetical protein